MQFVMRNCSCQGDHGQFCGAIGIYVLPQSSQEILQLPAALWIVANQSESLLAFANDAVGTQRIPAKLPSFSSVLSFDLL